MTYTVVPTITTGDVATAAWGNTHIKNNFAHFLTAGGLLLQERGGIEADISGIADGGMLVGTGAGTMAIRASALTAGAAGFLKHEVGGLEFNAAAIAAGGLVRGTGTGAMGILTIGGALQLLRTNAGLTDLEWVTQSLPLAAVKTANEAINNDTTVQNDDELVIAVAANTLYAFQLIFAITTLSATPGIDWKLSLPSGGSGRMTRMAGNSYLDVTAERTEQPGGAQTLIYDYDGFVKIAGTAGNVQLQWAQNVATGEDTSVLLGSSMILTAA